MTPMKRVESQGLFDYYQIEINCPEEGCAYYFRIQSGKIVVYYNKRGAMNEHQDYYDFRLIPGFHTPNWAKGAVFYQIFVDRFYNGDPSNDVEDREYIYIHQYSRKVTDWDSLPRPAMSAVSMAETSRGLWISWIICRSLAWMRST